MNFLPHYPANSKRWLPGYGDLDALSFKSTCTRIPESASQSCQIWSSLFYQDALVPKIAHQLTSLLVAQVAFPKQGSRDYPVSECLDVDGMERLTQSRYTFTVFYIALLETQSIIRVRTETKSAATCGFRKASNWINIAEFCLTVALTTVDVQLYAAACYFCLSTS